MYKKLFIPILFFFSLLFSCQPEPKLPNFDVLILGEGTGATTAAIQSARSGAKTLLIHPLPWLGGMLTAAGVSATDGNHQLPSGLWGEFREHLRNHYGGTDSLFTGWVSNTMFEPYVGAQIWDEMAAAESNLTIYKNGTWKTIEKGNNWKVQIQKKDGTEETVLTKILIDGTDLGDVAAQVGATYDLGMDSREKTGESMAPEKGNNIVQDLTYAAILKDFGEGEDKTIPKPDNYNPLEFKCCCKNNCDKEEAHECEKMLSYGKLPNKKYMLNWPKVGNDFYANVSEMQPEEREIIYEKARQKTLRYIYYIQTELGYINLGLADDEFPTKDRLALMPYHREGRRIHGLTQLNVNHILNPYDFEIYKTGIAVGDYPIDHHHAENENAPDIDFPMVPSFNVPAGCLIANNIDNLLIADKAISVTNIVNGSSRLQPVIIQIGQAAGLIGAIAAKKNISPKELSVREVQDSLISNNGYVMPFIDVTIDLPHFASVQRIGATGILKGTGIPYQWANQTWFYINSTISIKDFHKGLSDFDNRHIFRFRGDENSPVTIGEAITTLKQFSKILNLENTAFNGLKEKWEGDFGLNNYNESRNISRVELAVLIDKVIDPFHLKQVTFNINKGSRK